MNTQNRPVYIIYSYASRKIPARDIRRVCGQTIGPEVGPTRAGRTVLQDGNLYGEDVHVKYDRMSYGYRFYVQSDRVSVFWHQVVVHGRAHSLSAELFSSQPRECVSRAHGGMCHLVPRTIRVRSGVNFREFRYLRNRD